jgi:hypothetical protein
MPFFLYTRTVVLENTAVATQNVSSISIKMDVIFREMHVLYCNGGGGVKGLRSCRLYFHVFCKGEAQNCSL